ncbi:MAG: hypothetical protein ACQKBW_08825, partial [Puniceicoccales bacterium]
YDELLGRALDVWPEYEGFYQSACYRLLPRWHGRPGDWEAFLDALPEKLGDQDLADIMYARCVWYLLDRKIYNIEVRIFADSEATWAPVNHGYALLLELYPDSLYLLSQYCVMASEANDPETAYQLFERLNGRCDLGA